jgi:hypothetical protein
MNIIRLEERAAGWQKAGEPGKALRCLEVALKERVDMFGCDYFFHVLKGFS